jgi:hypothetical protein
MEPAARWNRADAQWTASPGLLMLQARDRGASEAGRETVLPALNRTVLFKLGACADFTGSDAPEPLFDQLMQQLAGSGVDATRRRGAIGTTGFALEARFCCTDPAQATRATMLLAGAYTVRVGRTHLRIPVEESRVQRAGEVVVEVANLPCELSSQASIQALLAATSYGETLQVGTSYHRLQPGFRQCLDLSSIRAVVMTPADDPHLRHLPQQLSFGQDRQGMPRVYQVRVLTDGRSYAGWASTTQNAGPTGRQPAAVPVPGVRDPVRVQQNQAASASPSMPRSADVPSIPQAARQPTQATQLQPRQQGLTHGQPIQQQPTGTADTVPTPMEDVVQQHGLRPPVQPPRTQTSQEPAQPVEAVATHVGYSPNDRSLGGHVPQPVTPPPLGPAPLEPMARSPGAQLQQRQASSPRRRGPGPARLPASPSQPPPHRRTGRTQMPSTPAAAVGQGAQVTNGAQVAEAPPMPVSLDSLITANQQAPAPSDAPAIAVDGRSQAEAATGLAGESGPPSWAVMVTAGRSLSPEGRMAPPALQPAASIAASGSAGPQPGPGTLVPALVNGWDEARLRVLEWGREQYPDASPTPAEAATALRFLSDGHPEVAKAILRLSDATEGLPGHLAKVFRPFLVAAVPALSLLTAAADEWSSGSDYADPDAHMEEAEWQVQRRRGSRNPRGDLHQYPTRTRRQPREYWQPLALPPPPEVGVKHRRHRGGRSGAESDESGPSSRPIQKTTHGAGRRSRQRGTP